MVEGYLSEGLMSANTELMLRWQITGDLVPQALQSAFGLSELLAVLDTGRVTSYIISAHESHGFSALGVAITTSARMWL